MKPINHWTFLSVENNRVDITTLESDGTQRHVLHVFVLESNLMRVLLKKDNALQLERSWCVSPNDSETGWQGRDRMSTEGFACPDFQVEELEDQLRISTAQLRVTIDSPLRLTWEYADDSGQWRYLASDRKSGAYMLGNL